METTERMSLACEPLDDVLGGGLEKGIITNVYGASGTGKTNVCVQAIASCLEGGGTALFIDTEGGFSTERFLQMHEDRESLERLVLMEPTTFEEQKEAFNRLGDVVEDEDIDLVVVDSLVALYRIRLREEASKSNTELSRQLSVLSKVARENNIPVLVTNQVYSPLESEELRMVGRDVPTYWSKCLLQLEKAGKNVRRAEVKKHRSRPEGLEAEFSITDEGLKSSVDAEVDIF